MAKQKFTPRPKESEAVITKRWTKKRDSIENLANNVQSLRYNVSLGLKNESKNEKNFLTCLVVALILKTGERVGNSASESNGHVGITGLKKDQLTIIGNKIILEYTGKSGVEHEKMFSDEKIAKALKIAKKNSPDNNIFTTSKGFKIKNVRINRFLSDFNVSAKDIRGYSSNNLLIRKLRDLEPEDTEAKRKRQFNKAARFVAKKIGHGLATMKKHYMLPELEPSFVEKSIVIDIDDVIKYNDGGDVKVEKNKGDIRKEADLLLGKLAASLLEFTNSSGSKSNLQKSLDDVLNYNIDWNKDVVLRVRNQKNNLVDSSKNEINKNIKKQGGELKYKVSTSSDKFTCKDAVPDSKLKKSLPKEVKEILKEEYSLENGGGLNFTKPKKLEDGGKIADSHSIEQIENKLGRELHWWNDDIVYLSGVKYKKVYLRPEYKRVIE
jgi:DNA topoisomerase IB